MAGYGGQVCLQSWPTYDESKTVTATTQMAVQVGGKVKANIVVPTDAPTRTSWPPLWPSPRSRSWPRA